MRCRTLLAAALVVSAVGCGTTEKDGSDVKMSEIEPTVVDLVDRAVATVSDEPRPNGELGPRPCFSGPPVRDLGTQQLWYGFLVDVDAGDGPRTAGELVDFLTAEGLEALEPRTVGTLQDRALKGDGFLISVEFAEDNEVVRVVGTTECIDP